jgi:hypothetical protein
MRRVISWLSVGCALSLALALGARAVGSERRASVPAAAASVASAERLLQARVSDVTSPEYREWRTAVQAARFGVDAVLEALAGDLASAQKAAILGSLLDDVAALSSVERRALQERLSGMVLAEELDADLGDIVGRLLRALDTPEQQRELAGMYRELDEQLAAHNKAAIVHASGDRGFVESIMNDSAQPSEAREQAIERVAELGASQSLRALGEPGGDPTLRATALRAMGQYAEDEASLRETIAAAAEQPEVDRFGRDVRVAARVGVSESSVLGKSLVLCVDWKQRVSVAAQQSEDELVSSLVAGKAFARALLSDADARAAARCIDEQLAPLISGLSQGAAAPQQLQLVAELSTDLKGECSLRPEPACVDPNDRRSRYGVELAQIVRPLLPGTGLEHYLSLLPVR